MHFLDLCDDVLLEILLLVDPIDLVNISNVFERLRALAERLINKVFLKLQLTGAQCFPNLKPQLFDNLDRIRVNRNWLIGKFSTRELYRTDDAIDGGIVVDEHFYIADEGAIRKYDRLWNGEYLSSDFKLIGNKNHSEITEFSKKDSVLFAGCRDGSCIIFEDEKLAMERTMYSPYPACALDLFPKNDIYVAAFWDHVKIWNKRPKDKTFFLVDEIDLSGNTVKIHPSGEEFIVGITEYVILYDFNSKNKERLLELDNSLDLLWKDNQTILSGHQDGSLRLFDLRTKSVSQQIVPLWRDSMISIQFDGINAVLCGQMVSNRVVIYDLRMNKVLKELSLFNEEEIDYDLLQIVADPKHLFVVTEAEVHVFDFSV